MELKPCPFCGSSDLKLQVSDVHIKCLACEAEMSRWDGEDIVALWNTRVTRPMTDNEKAVIEAAMMLRINFPAGKPWTKEQIALADALREYNISRLTAGAEPEKPCDYCRYPAGTHGTKCKFAPASEKRDGPCRRCESMLNHYAGNRVECGCNCSPSCDKPKESGPEKSCCKAAAEGKCVGHGHPIPPPRSPGRSRE